ncbi:MAG: YeeE/YedE family protein [Alphaproteobacteria bacterium]
MENFTPVAGLAGGLLIGAAASLFVLLNGRVLGISGIVGGLFGGAGGDLPGRIALIAGIVLGPLLYGAAGGVVPAIDVSDSLPLLVVGGLLVGFGTRLGNGCTSGHGICGLARVSPRSLAATGVFFATAAITVFVVRHVAGG